MGVRTALGMSSAAASKGEAMQQKLRFLRCQSPKKQQITSPSMHRSSVGLCSPQSLGNLVEGGSISKPASTTA